MSNDMKNTHASEHLMEKAKELFLRYGVKSVSMDEIAQFAGVSKNLLYRFFSSKAAFVHAFVSSMIEAHAAVVKKATAGSKDAIDEVLKENAGMTALCRTDYPDLFYQVEKYFPDSWELVEQYQSEIYKTISDNLSRGKAEGLFRDDIDDALIADLRLRQVINVLRPELLTSFNLSINELAREFTRLYLHAITTKKGKELLAKYSDNTGEINPGDKNQNNQL